MIAQFPNQTDLEALASQANVAIEAGKIGGVATYRVTPNGGARPPHQDNVFLYIHGGAYVFGGGDAAVPEAAVISAFAGNPLGCRGLPHAARSPVPGRGGRRGGGLPRVAEGPFTRPDRHRRHVGGWRTLVGRHSPASRRLQSARSRRRLSRDAVGGSHRHQRLPAHARGHRPHPRDLRRHAGLRRQAVRGRHAADRSADLAGLRRLHRPFPPTYLVTGTRDMLLSDTARVHRKLKAAGVVADLNVYEGLSHAEYMMLVGSLRRTCRPMASWPGS